jgi:glycerophosphoryl diester phosphodiesterase
MPIELHGHRGARGLWPENTIPGFEAALRLGVTAIEMDVAMTADGVAILSHDPVLDPDLTRGPDGRWDVPPGTLIRDLTEADLAGYDIGCIRPGSAQESRFPEQRAQGGVRFPRLADIVALDEQVMLAIELKTFPDHPDWTLSPEEMAERVLAILEDAGAVARSRIISFDWRSLRHLARIRPQVSLGYLTDTETVAAAGLWWDGPTPQDFGGSVPHAIAAEGGKVWGPDAEDLTEIEVATAHAVGLLVNPWTVNEPSEMARLLGWGVGALTTDYPNRAAKAIAALVA